MCAIKARIILLSCLEYVCYQSKNYSAKLSRIICVLSKQELFCSVVYNNMCAIKARIIMLSCAEYVCYQSKNYSAKLSRICVLSKQELFC